MPFLFDTVASSNPAEKTLPIPDSATLDQIVLQVTAFLDGAGLYFGHGSLDASDEAAWLVLAAAGLPLDEEPNWDKTLGADQRAAVAALAAERVASRKPLAYLTGEAWFAGVPITVDERVLVPRSFIAEWIPDQFAPWIQADRIGSVLDLCCGSGCIGIATALALPDTEVVLSDISDDALAVAALNIGRHGLSDRVKLRQSDGLARIDGTFDLVVCNPPYVSSRRMDTLPAEYRHEPALGLAAGDDGLDFIRPMLQNVTRVLNPGGVLLLEAGSAGPTMEEVWPTVPFTWLGTEFDEMVLCMLTREQLVDHGEALSSLAIQVAS